MTKREQLAEVNAAISAILVGGQAYRIGTRSLTRADLAALRAMRDDLEAQVDSDAASGLMPNTFAAFFDGR